jgi:hypothetical protein
VKSSKAKIFAKFHKIPTIRFEDQKLTSFSGLLIFVGLFMKMNLKRRLKQCFSHLKISIIFGCHLVVFLLIVHLLPGFRRLREVDYYRDDPLVLLLLLRFFLFLIAMCSSTAGCAVVCHHTVHPG